MFLSTSFSFWIESSAHLSVKHMAVHCFDLVSNVIWQDKNFDKAVNEFTFIKQD